MAAITPLETSSENICFTINKDNPSTVFQAIGAYVKKHGAYDVLCVIEKSFEGAVCSSNILGLTSKCVQDLNSTIKSLGSAKKWLIITKILSITSQNFNKNFWAFKQSVEGFFSKKTAKLIYASLDLFLDLLSFGLLFRVSKYAHYVIDEVSKGGFSVLHSWDLQEAWVNLTEANWLEKTNKNGDIDCASENKAEVDIFIKENKRCCMLKAAATVANLMKDYISIIGLFLGHAVFTSFSWPLSVIVLVLRVSKDFYSDSMTYKRV